MGWFRAKLSIVSPSLNHGEWGELDSMSLALAFKFKFRKYWPLGFVTQRSYSKNKLIISHNVLQIVIHIVHIQIEWNRIYLQQQQHIVLQNRFFLSFSTLIGKCYSGQHSWGREAYFRDVLHVYWRIGYVPLSIRPHNITSACFMSQLLVCFRLLTKYRVNQWICLNMFPP